MTLPCREVPDPEIFFPPSGGANAPITAAAKAACSNCSMRAECLQAAMAAERVDGLRYGIWGGLTPSERRELAGAAA